MSCFQCVSQEILSSQIKLFISVMCERLRFCSGYICQLCVGGVNFNSVISNGPILYVRGVNFCDVSADSLTPRTSVR